MKNITIQVEWPFAISALDSEHQFVLVTRKKGYDTENPSDRDQCNIVSNLQGDRESQKGTVAWGEAFAAIQQMFNCTSCD